MATAAAKIEYASKATYGNTAYDLNRVRRGGAVYDVPFDIPAETPERQPEEQQRPRTEKQVRTQTHAQTRTRAKTQAMPGISLFSIVGFTALAVLLVFILLANVELTKVSSETAQLQDTMEELKTEQAKLTVGYESAFNLNEIEEYATGVLGMTKLTDDDTVMFSVTTEDKAVIMDDGSKGGLEIFGTLTSVLSSLTEYFR